MAGRRLYLYFHERILGKLICDDTFALPFWNWDAPDGMHLPLIYADTSSPLYDEKREPGHAQPPFPLVDLDYNHRPYTEATIDNNNHRQIEKNLKIMYRQVSILYISYLYTIISLKLIHITPNIIASTLDRVN